MTSRIALAHQSRDTLIFWPRSFFRKLIIDRRASKKWVNSLIGCNLLDTVHLADRVGKVTPPRNRMRRSSDIVMAGRHDIKISRCNDILGDL